MFEKQINALTTILRDKDIRDYSGDLFMNIIKASKSAKQIPLHFVPKQDCWYVKDYVFHITCSIQYGTYIA